jgi:hypothetical protein
MKTVSWNSIILHLSAFLVFTMVALCQPGPRVTITGTVRDDSTSVGLPNADVYIAGTTMGSATDQFGWFTIQNVPLGFHEIVASRVGYGLCSIRVTIAASGNQILELRLRPAPIQLSEVVVTAQDPSEWRKQLERFKRLFLGTTPVAKSCTITNPEVLDFSEEDDILVASARSSLAIENPSLGYHLQFYLTKFRSEPPGSLNGWQETVTYSGLLKYTEFVESTPGQKALWSEVRASAFKGSLRHFLISLVNGNLRNDGYAINLMPKIVIEGMSAFRMAVDAINMSEIISGWASQSARVLHFNGFLEVEYRKAVREDGYDLLTKKGTDVQVSWFRLTRDSITVNSFGLVLEPFPVKSYGYWAWKRLGDALPLDYEPEN